MKWNQEDCSEVLPELLTLAFTLLIILASKIRTVGLCPIVLGEVTGHICDWLLCLYFRTGTSKSSLHSHFGKAHTMCEHGLLIPGSFLVLAPSSGGFPWNQIILTAGVTVMYGTHFCC